MFIAFDSQGVALGWHQVVPLGRKPIVAVAHYTGILLLECLAMDLTARLEQTYSIHNYSANRRMSRYCRPL